VLWASSTPIVARPLFAAIEGNQVRIPAVEAVPADAIVVLSSGRIVAPGPAAISEWQDADRFFAGLELFKAGKAPLLVFTGGWSPALRPDDLLEGSVLATYAAQMGVPAAQVVTTGRVANTQEEAAAVASTLRSLGQVRPRVLLVTSAFHMVRARMLFERNGLTVLPFPVDFAGRGGGFRIFDVIPTVGALSMTQCSLREWYGRLYYRLRS